MARLYALLKKQREKERQNEKKAFGKMFGVGGGNKNKSVDTQVVEAQNEDPTDAVSSLSSRLAALGLESQGEEVNLES